MPYDSGDLVPLNSILLYRSSPLLLQVDDLLREVAEESGLEIEDKLKDAPQSETAAPTEREESQLTHRWVCTTDHAPFTGVAAQDMLLSLPPLCLPPSSLLPPPFLCLRPSSLPPSYPPCLPPSTLPPPSLLLPSLFISPFSCEDYNSSETLHWRTNTFVGPLSDLPTSVSSHRVFVQQYQYMHALVPTLVLLVLYNNTVTA